MARKPYTPVAPYAELKRVESLIEQATSIDQIRRLVLKDGSKVGYKAFCYILGGRMTPEAMKPDEACTAALQLEQQGKAEEAVIIYNKVLAVHPDQAAAAAKVAAASET
jgi:hypothetical protein